LNNSLAKKIHITSLVIGFAQILFSIFFGEYIEYKYSKLYGISELIVLFAILISAINLKKDEWF